VPGCPDLLRHAAPTVIDVRSGAAAGGGPEDLLFQMAGGQMARRYGLPSSIGTFATGAKASDWQAGAEGALSVVASWLGGADMLCGAGAGSRRGDATRRPSWSWDAETFGWCAGWPRACRCPRRTSRWSSSSRSAPAGTSWQRRHTATHARDLWRPALFGRETIDSWEASGRPEPVDRARERARRILATQEPVPLEPGLAAELDRLVADATARPQPTRRACRPWCPPRLRGPGAHVHGLSGRRPSPSRQAEAAPPELAGVRAVREPRARRVRPTRGDALRVQDRLDRAVPTGRALHRREPGRLVVAVDQLDQRLRLAAVLAPPGENRTITRSGSPGLARIFGSSTAWRTSRAPR